MTTDRCPSTYELQAAASGSLTAVHSLWITRHARSCVSCTTELLPLEKRSTYFAAPPAPRDPAMTLLIVLTVTLIVLLVVCGVYFQPDALLRTPAPDCTLPMSGCVTECRRCLGGCVDY